MNPWMIILIETLAITAIGSLLHFAYAWSGYKKWMAAFAAVNESTWEHVKLALSGTFACMLVDVWFLGSNPNYWLARSVSFLVPIIVIPIVFYGYTNFTRRAVLPVDILTFAAAAFLGSAAFVGILEAPAFSDGVNFLAGIVSLLIMVLYLLLTYFPLPRNRMFEDPITHKYGLAAVKKPVRKSLRKTASKATKQSSQKSRAKKSRK